MKEPKIWLNDKFINHDVVPKSSKKTEKSGNDNKLYPIKKRIINSEIFFCFFDFGLYPKIISFM